LCGAVAVAPADVLAAYAHDHQTCRKLQMAHRAGMFTCVAGAVLLLLWRVPALAGSMEANTKMWVRPKPGESDRKQQQY
jgi:hypothetical protein